MREAATGFREPPGEIYARLLRDYWRQGGEEPLIQAADLGKVLVYAGRPPEEIGEFQQQALLALARELPAVTLEEAATQLTPPLIEVLIAYGLAFREQMKQRYESLIEQRLQQTHQMEALGTLAAGIAHDFNTILGVILGGLLAPDIDSDDDGIKESLSIGVRLKATSAMIDGVAE